MQPTPSLLSTMGFTILKHVLKYLTYSQILDLFRLNIEFGLVRNDECFYQTLLEDHFGVPASKKGDFKQYYSVFRTLLARVESMHKSSGHATPFNKAQFELEMYRSLKKEQKKYENVDVDVRFIMLRSLGNLHQRRYVLGGIMYYNFQEFYMTFRDEEIQLDNLSLYPQVMLGHALIAADFDNKIGFGERQRYLIFDFDQQKITFIKWSQNPFKKTTQRSENYQDYFETLSHPKSDCTTRGIRIRTDARLVLCDPRFNLEAPFFSYQIRFSDNGASEKGAKLLMRKWIIRSYSANGEEKVDTVEGEGVIGFYPHIYKGCQDFIYQSCCAVKGIRGVMEGHFQFCDEETKEKFNVIVQPFSLAFGPNVAYSVNRQSGEIKVLA